MVAEDRFAALEERVAKLEGGAGEPWRGGWSAGARRLGESLGAAGSAARVPDGAPSPASRPGAGESSPAAPQDGPERPATPYTARPYGGPVPPALPALRHGPVAGPRDGALRPAGPRDGAASASLPRYGAPRVVPPRASSPWPFASAPPRVKKQAPKRDLEDIVGGSVLAWLGGVAVLAGLLFLLTMSISRGWIGEGARTALAGVVSVGLLGAGVWLRERKRQTEASLAAAAVGIAGLFGTLVVAGPVYHLIPASLAFATAFATGAYATWLAIQWRAEGMGWLGLLGALLAPTLLDAVDGGGMVFLAIAFAATIGVVVSQRWTVLGVIAYTVTTLEWLAFALDATAPAATLIVFGVLTVVYALGIEGARRGALPVRIGPRARAHTHLLAVGVFAVNATLLAAAGWVVLDGGTWLAILALSFIALGVALTHVDRITREFALIVLAIGIVLANIAFAALATGLPLVIGWALSAVPFAAILGARSGQPTGVARIVDTVIGRPDDESGRRADRILALAGLLGQIALTGFQGLVFDAPVALLNGPLAPSAALAAAGAIALVAWTCARLAGEQYRMWLDTLALTAVAHFTGLALEGAALAATLAAEALALGALARRHGDLYTAWAAAAFATLSVSLTLLTLATPDALFVGLDDSLGAAGALAAAAAALFMVSRVELRVPHSRRIFETLAAVTVLYLASVEVVTLAGPDHTGQTLLSVLWAFAGVGALIRGLLIDDRQLRQGALIFLAITVSKVFFYDLASLDSLYRVGSLIGLGLLLLCGAFAWQQVRPNGANAS